MTNTNVEVLKVESNGGISLIRRVSSGLIELLWRVLILFLHVFFRIIMFVRREGPYLPGGPVIVVPNHCSFIDPILAQLVCWRHLSPMMTEVYYDLWYLRWFFRWFRAIPVKESRGNRDAINVAVNRVKQGWALCIYPEGGISKDGKLQKFQPGIAALAEATRACVVPMAIIGSYEAFPRHAKFPKLFRRYIIRLGEPIPPPEEGDERSRRGRLRAYTERVRQGVAALCEPHMLPAPESEQDENNK